MCLELPITSWNLFINSFSCIIIFLYDQCFSSFGKASESVRRRLRVDYMKLIQISFEEVNTFSLQTYRIWHLETLLDE